VSQPRTSLGSRKRSPRRRLSFGRTGGASTIRDRPLGGGGTGAINSEKTESANPQTRNTTSNRAWPTRHWGKSYIKKKVRTRSSHHGAKENRDARNRSGEKKEWGSRGKKRSTKRKTGRRMGPAGKVSGKPRDPVNSRKELQIETELDSPRDEQVMKPFGEKRSKQSIRQPLRGKKRNQERWFVARGNPPDAADTEEPFRSTNQRTSLLWHGRQSPSPKGHLEVGSSEPMDQDRGEVSVVNV